MGESEALATARAELAFAQRIADTRLAELNRQSARADAAESVLAAANAELAIWRDEDAREAKYEYVSKRCTAAEEALAAARRECAEQCDAKDAAYEVIYRTRDLLDECDDVLACVQGHGCPPSGETVAALRKKIRTALASPAAGEEG